MRETSEIFIPIPKARNTNVIVGITPDGGSEADVTGRVIESSWVKPTTTGNGTFKCKISNASGQYSDSWNKGDTIKFYADNTGQGTGTPRLQFYGRIDYIKDSLSAEGQFLELEGRHIGYLSTETLICHSATSTDPAQILKDVMDKYLVAYGFTYTAVASTSITIDVEWNYKNFWDCINELCQRAGFDAYIDNDLDMHFFEANSVLNEMEAIAEKYNFLKMEDWGTDDYYERTRVIVVGQDDTQLPIVYTAISEGEGTSLREIFVKNASANTEDKCKDIAEAKLAEYSNRAPQAVAETFGLETIEPGENVWIVVPRQKIYGQYKILQITHLFGAKHGGWRTKSLIEQEIGGTEQILKLSKQETRDITQAENPNKLNFSYNHTYDDTTKTQSQSGTSITNGKLIVLTQAGLEGTWISTRKIADDNVTKVEMRAKGKDIKDSEFYFSLNNGSTWEQVDYDDMGTLITPASIGRNIVLKVILKRAYGWGYLMPELDSLVLLYS